MALQLKNTNGLAVNPYIKAIIYGPSGIGKTYLARTIPNCLILSAEAGLIGLRKMSIDYFVIKSMEEFIEAYNFILSKNGDRWNTVFIDSLSEIAEVLLTSEKSQTKDPRKAYGEVKDRIVEAIRYYRDIPNKNVIFTAKEEMIRDEKNGYLMSMPSFPGQKLPQEVPYLFDEVYHLEVYPQQDGSKIRALRTQIDTGIWAKSRVDCLDQWEPADLGALFEKIKKG